MKIKQTQKPVIASAMAAALLFLGGGLAAQAQQHVVTNEFNIGQDYVLSGIIGDTNFDGVYLNGGDLPFGPGFGATTREAGDGASKTLVANDNLSYPPYQVGSPATALQVAQTAGDWAGENDDGFFLWKLVTGDFSVAVRTLPNWPTAGDSFGGLMVRPWNTNNTGAPVSFISTNQDENFLILYRDQEFQIDQIRQSSNGVNGVTGQTLDQQYSFADMAGTNNETNYPFFGLNSFGTNVLGQTSGNSETVAGTTLSRWYRIDRVNATNFVFYWSTNQPSDPTFTWLLITNAGGGPGYTKATGTVVRPDWSNCQMQVGIAQAFYTGVANTALQQFDSFSITGTNLNQALGPLPTQASAVQVASSNPNGTVTLSWTPGTYGDGVTPAPSIVLLRPNANIIVQPISGNTSLPFAESDITNADVNNAQYGASNNLVVFAGAGTGCTISGLGSSLVNYTVAVFSYTNSATSGILYNTANVTPLTFSGPGQITAITAVVGPTNMPVGGVGVVNMTATYSTGGTFPFNSATPGVTVTSDNTAVVNPTGPTGSTLQALTLGSANISISLTTPNGTLTTPNVLVSTHSVAFTDNFTNVHDYVALRLAGSDWDGLYLNYGDNPTPNGATGYQAIQDTTAVFGASTADTTGPSATGQTNALFIASTGGDWGGLPGGTSASGSDGPFLFKNVPGDFEVWTHITNMGVLNTDCLGLMARFYVAAPSAGAGGRFGPLANGFENHVNIWKQQDGAVDAFATLRYTTSEVTDSAAVRTTLQTTNGGNTVNTWLMMQRLQGTNFYFYTKSATNDNWGPIGYLYVDPSGANLPLQVGIAEQIIGAATSSGAVDNFNLDATNIATSAGTDPSGLTNAPPAATGLTAVINPDLSGTFSWTSSSNGVPVASILVLRADLPVNETPYYGEALAAGPYNHPYGQAGDNIGSSNYAVWRSADHPASTVNSVTITGLPPSHIVYAQVFTYDGTGAATLYNNDASPASANLNITIGTVSGMETGISSIPVGGLSRIQTLEQFLPSPATVDISSSAAAVSSDPTTVVVSGALATGLKVGSAFITNTATINGSKYTNIVSVTVHAPSYVDNFNVNHDYLQNGVAGTLWDGVYAAGTGYIPEQTTKNSTAVATTILATNLYMDQFVTGTTNTNTILLTNVLVVTNVGGGWEGPDDGFFLFKVVPGDFQMVVHMDDYSANTAYCEEGIMARAFSDATNAADVATAYNLGAGTTNYAPFVFGTNANGSLHQGETWVSLNRYDQYTIGTYARQNVLGAFTESTQSGGDNVNTILASQFNSSSNGADGKSWLMIQRVNYTNFYFYAKKSATGPWLAVPSGTTYSIAQVAGVPMQVGIADMSFSTATAWAKYDSFMLDVAPTVITIVNNGNGTLTLSWPASPNFGHLYSSPVVPAKFSQLGGAVITTDNGISSTVVPLGNQNVFYEVGP